MTQPGSTVRNVDITNNERDAESDILARDSGSMSSATGSVICGITTLVPDDAIRKMNNNANSFNDPLRGFENYFSWKRNLRTALHLGGMYRFFEARISKPTDPVELDRWELANAWITNLILMSVSPDLIQGLQLDHKDDYISMIETIKSFIMNQGRDEFPLLELKWRNLKFTTLEDTVKQMYHLRDLFQFVSNEQMTERQMISKLNSITPKLLSMFGVEAYLMNNDLSFANLVEKLRGHVRALNYRQECLSLVEKEVKTKSNEKSAKPTKAKPQVSLQHTEAKEVIVTCNTCHKPGHKEEKCFRNQKCFKCGRKGHIAKFCKDKTAAKFVWLAILLKVRPISMVPTNLGRVHIM